MNLSVLGAGGHAKVALEAWRSTGSDIRALYDDRIDLHGTTVLGVRILGALAEGLASSDRLHVAIGDNGARARIGAQLDDDRCPPVIHARAHVSPTAVLAAGTLVCAGAVVQAEARIGRHTILNSQSLVEHDVEIGDYVHIAPGVRLGGAVRIGARAMIGIGAILLPGVEVGRDAIVGAGAVVLRDVPDMVLVAGNPAKPIRNE